jgi:hypothetical protein
MFTTSVSAWIKSGVSDFRMPSVTDFRKPGKDRNGQVSPTREQTANAGVNVLFSQLDSSIGADPTSGQ